MMVSFKPLVAALVAISSLASATNTTTNVTQACTGPLKERREWRTLTNQQKDEYIEAVLCLQRLPSTSGQIAARSRFDDFQGVHITLADEIHLVGQFLPWHRRFLNVYETTLRSECGYTGTIPYWNWSEDVAKPFKEAPVFDATHGFGGDGAYIKGFTGAYGNLTILTEAGTGWEVSNAGGGCVQDGPFKDYVIIRGPGTAVTPHCLTRALNDNTKHFLSYAEVANISAYTTFETFRIELEGLPITPRVKIHDGGHFTVGGEMADRYSSPGDPLFYLHHGNLDRIWWNWQQVDPTNRLYQISGRSSVDPPFTNVTLAFKLKMLGLSTDIPLLDVMDIGNELLCYKYV